jgi:drug/metabolite transporter (DMT)-like permease
LSVQKQAVGGARPGPSLVMLASVSAVGSSFLFTASHGVVRHLGSTMHPFQIAFFSTLFSALFFVPILLRYGPSLLRTTKIHLHLGRTLFNAGSLTGWYVALSMTPLADATALAFAGPLFATLGAAVFLGERMRARRWIALGVGLAGALIILRPGFQAISLGYLFVLLAAVGNAGGKLFAKHLTRWDSPLTCSALIAILQTPITLGLALFVWQTPSWIELGWLAVVGVFVAMAQIAMVQAFKLADVGAMEPLNFTRLIWAALIGYFVFTEIPGLWTWVGAAVIVAASTYIARRESKAATSSAARVPEPSTGV